MNYLLTALAEIGYIELKKLEKAMGTPKSLRDIAHSLETEAEELRRHAEAMDPPTVEEEENGTDYTASSFHELKLLVAEGIEEIIVTDRLVIDQPLSVEQDLKLTLHSDMESRANIEVRGGAFQVDGNDHTVTGTKQDMNKFVRQTGGAVLLRDLRMRDFGYGIESLAGVTSVWACSIHESTKYGIWKEGEHIDVQDLVIDGVLKEHGFRCYCAASVQRLHSKNIRSGKRGYWQAQGPVLLRDSDFDDSGRITIGPDLKQGSTVDGFTIQGVAARECTIWNGSLNGTITGCRMDILTFGSPRGAIQPLPERITVENHTGWIRPSSWFGERGIMIT